MSNPETDSNVWFTSFGDYRLFLVRKLLLARSVLPTVGENPASTEDTLMLRMFKLVGETPDLG